MGVVWTILAVTCLVETVLILSDHGLVGTRLWRPLAYQYGAFWAGLLDDWRPNFALQPIAMFFSYPFLHTGPIHLAGNMIVLVWLGRCLVPDWGPLRFLGLYLLSAIGGGLVFAAAPPGPAPMVGASGALFGLAGAWLVQEWHEAGQPRTAGGMSRSGTLIRVAGMVFLLIALNLISWILQDGLLAWQAHLGGGITGLMLAASNRPDSSKTPRGR